jgi:hypothetical protein
MNIQTAILPHKHITFSQSLLGTAGMLRGLLTQPRTVDELWSLSRNGTSDWPAKPTFTEVILAVDLLFLIGEVSAAPDGRVRRPHDETA